MSTTYNHAQIGIVDSVGNVNVIYPATTGNDVSISRSKNTIIPSTVTNLQDLVNVFGSLAFKSTIIDDGSTTSSTSTWSAKKIHQLELTKLDWSPVAKKGKIDCLVNSTAYKNNILIFFSFYALLSPDSNNYCDISIPYVSSIPVALSTTRINIVDKADKMAYISGNSDVFSIFLSTEKTECLISGFYFMKIQ